MRVMNRLTRAEMTKGGEDSGVPRGRGQQGRGQGGPGEDGWKGRWHWDKEWRIMKSITFT